MNDIQSQSSSLNQRVYDFFVPSRTELGAYLLISIVLLLAYNAKTLVNILNDKFLAVSGASAGYDFGSLMDRFSGFFNTVTSGRLTQMLFWAFVGSTIYVIAWFAKNILVSLRNDLVADHFAHPSSYSRLTYWESAIAKKIFLGAIAIVFFTFVSVCLILVLPALAHLAFATLYDFQMPQTAIELAFAVVGTGSLIYLFVLLVKTASHTWKVI